MVFNVVRIVVYSAMKTVSYVTEITNIGFSLLSFKIYNDEKVFYQPRNDGNSFFISDPCQLFKG